jgi:hypothetical protein
MAAHFFLCRKKPLTLYVAGGELFWHCLLFMLLSFFFSSRKKSCLRWWFFFSQKNEAASNQCDQKYFGKAVTVFQKSPNIVPCQKSICLWLIMFLILLKIG